MVMTYNWTLYNWPAGQLSRSLAIARIYIYILYIIIVLYTVELLLEAPSEIFICGWMEWADLDIFQVDRYNVITTYSYNSVVHMYDW